MKKKVIAIILVCVTLIVSGAAVLAYDSSSDPIVSLSYLTDVFKPQILNELSAEITSKVSEAVGKIAGNAQTPADNQQSSNEQPVQSGYTVIEMTAGDELYALDACDIMLRAGDAVCIAPDPKQGIADYTDATEILNGAALIKNHMCLIPRGDGRGVRAESASVYIMVRGNYTIVKH